MSEAIETLSGVTQLKIRDIFLFIYVWTYTPKLTHLVYRSLSVSSIVYPFELVVNESDFVWMQFMAYKLRSSFSIRISIVLALFVIVLALRNSIVLT